jgi:hypothetical protein
MEAGKALYHEAGRGATAYPVNKNTQLPADVANCLQTAIFSRWMQREATPYNMNQGR